jgi:hypothetical protein
MVDEVVAARQHQTYQEMLVVWACTGTAVAAMENPPEAMIQNRLDPQRSLSSIGRRPLTLGRFLVIRRAPDDANCRRGIPQDVSNPKKRRRLT